MKKLGAILGLWGLAATGGFAQGFVNFANALGFLVSTNGTGVGGTVGATAGSAGSFYYGLFVASSTVATIDSSLQGLLSPTWTFTGNYATNTANHGRFFGNGTVSQSL